MEMGFLSRMSDGGKRRQGWVSTIPRSILQWGHCKCDRRCTAELHLYATPENPAKLKPLGTRWFKPLFVECDPEERAGTGMLPFKDMNSIPYEAEYAPYKAESGGSEIFEYAKLLQGQWSRNWTLFDMSTPSISKVVEADKRVSLVYELLQTSGKYVHIINFYMLSIIVY